MELWIRSQDKMVLTKIYDLKVDLHIGNEYKIQGNLDEIKADYYLLGTYKTKERALEVLDEIQNYILLPNTDNSAYVYRMPEE